MATYVTPNGTPWTSFSATVAGQVVRWAVADAVASTADIPTILYAHGAGGGSNQFETLGAWAGMRNWLIDNGWAWVESQGGGAQPWGNQASRDAYESALTHVSGLLDIGAVVPLGRSMGGLVTYWLATQSTIVAPRAVGFIINSGTTDLAATYARPERVDAVEAAYGFTGSGGYAAATAGFDPMLFPLSTWDGVKVLQLWGDADDTVPAVDHAIAIRTRWAGRPTLDAYDIRAGGDHSATNGSYLQVAAMSDFLLEVTGQTVPEPIVTPSYQIVREYAVIGGRSYPIVPKVA